MMTVVQKTRCLIVVMGGISCQMHGVLKTKPWYECVGVVDVTDAGLADRREVAALPDSALFKDLGRALSALKPDVVLINTPSELHFAQTKQCLEAECRRGRTERWPNLGLDTIVPLAEETMAWKSISVS